MTNEHGRRNLMQSNSHGFLLLEVASIARLCYSLVGRRDTAPAKGKRQGNRVASVDARPSSAIAARFIGGIDEPEMD
jgi:hypothetical protein